MILFKRRLQTNMGKKILIIFAVLVFASCVAFASTKEKGAAEKPEKITIVVYEPVEAKGMAEFGKIFKEKYDIEVEVFTVPWANLHEKIIADLTAQTGTYDLIAIPGLWSLEFIYAGYIEPLDTYWENPDYPSFDIEDYPQDIVNLVADEDHVYWIPHHATTQILFYRKDIFEKENLKPPQTYDELFRIAELLTNNPKYPEVYGFGTTAKQGEWASSTWSTWIWSWGGDYFDKNWHCIFNNAKGVASLEAYAEAVNRFAPSDCPNWGNEEGGAAMQQGRLAMLQMWPYLATAMDDPSQSKVVGKVGYAPMPKKELRFPRLGSWGLTISKYSKNKEWAWRYMAEFNSKENVETIHREAGMPICRTSVASVIAKEDPLFKAVFESFEHTKERPGIPEITQIIDVWGLAVSRVVVGDADAQTALDEAAEEIEVILRDGGYIKD
jgi:multiple sugar transport system substrate-binding protein